MRCKRCNKEIDELEMFCDDCKKVLKNESSRSELKELENLIEDHQKLNEFEITKEIDNISELINEENINKQIQEDIKEEIIEEQNNTIEEEKETRISRNLKVQKQKKSKKLVIILSIIISLLIIVIFLFLIFNKPKKQIKEEKIDYEKIINEYGNAVVKVTKKYILDNNSVPTWKSVLENLSYKKYDVVCSKHEIYEDGSIYLEKCTIDKMKVKFTYGEKNVENKEEGKKIEIYKSNIDNNNYGDTKYNNDFALVGTINCQTKNCKYIDAYNNYVLIMENKQYYLYDYNNNSINFGPFDMDNEYTDMLSYNFNLYGIIYRDQNERKLYNIKNNKILKNIKGNVEESGMYYEPNVLLKYNLLVLKNANKYDFVNINTGNISFTINANIKEFIEDAKNKIVYITTYTTDNSKFKIYNSNGKLLFDGKEYNYINISDNIIVSTFTNFKVYDTKLNLKITSKKYNKIIGVYKNFVVVSNDNKLVLINLNDKEIVSFDIDLENGNYTFHGMLSGYKDENTIRLVIENNDISYGTKGSGIECLYNLSTKESNIIETDGISGYGI